LGYHQNTDSAGFSGIQRCPQTGRYHPVEREVRRGIYPADLVITDEVGILPKRLVDGIIAKNLGSR
jgi:hypothetical protein